MEELGRDTRREIEGHEGREGEVKEAGEEGSTEGYPPLRMKTLATNLDTQ